MLVLQNDYITSSLTLITLFLPSTALFTFILPSEILYFCMEFFKSVLVLLLQELDISLH